MPTSEVPFGTSFFRPLPSLAAILAACILVYWLGLGSTGLSLSEGHRVVPAWEMLDTGDWSATRMFGELYFRKPPGMMWAIAASSSLLGQTEFAARAVSALACTLMAMLAWAFGRRWFGPQGGFLAGFCQALSPMLWEAGRSAEIEALHTLFVQLACLGALDAAWKLAASPKRPVLAAVWITLGVFGAMLTKGPAGLPALGGALLAGLWLTHASRLRYATVALGSAFLSLAASALCLWLLSKHSASLGEAVRQSPGEFLWDTSKLASILTLPLVGILIGLPASVALALVPRTRNLAAACVLAALLGLAVFTLSGVSNARYVMPIVPLWPLALAGVAQLPRFQTRAAVHLARGIAVLLLIASVTLGRLGDQARNGDGGRGSGRSAGIAIAREIHDRFGAAPVEIWADGAIEARPEVLLYARRAAKDLGLDLRPRWNSALLRPFSPPANACLLVRADFNGSSETWEGSERVRAGRPKLWSGTVGKFGMVVLGPQPPLASLY